jgi:hypothetical protein
VKDHIVVLCADREMMPHEETGENYAELLALNPDADLKAHQATFIYYGPFTTTEAEQYAELVGGHVYELVAPVAA